MVNADKPPLYIVMTAQAQKPASKGGIHRSVAVVKTDEETYPKLLAFRACGVVDILWRSPPLRTGKPHRGAYQAALAYAQGLAADLNRDYGLEVGRRATITELGNDFHREEIPARRRPVYDPVMINETAIRARYEAIKDRLDERDRRVFVAAQKIAAGYGGTAAVSRASEHAREGSRSAQHDHSRRGQGSSDGASGDGASTAQGCGPTGAKPVQPSRAGRPPPAGGTGEHGGSDATLAVGIDESGEAGCCSAHFEPRSQCQHGG